MSKNRTYYIEENQDVFRFFADQDIDLPNGVRQQIAFISKKSYNNYIGYYQFVHQGIYYKFFVMPKIYRNAAKAEKEGLFSHFLGQYYQLKNKYPDKIHAKDINGNIIDFSFEHYEDLNSKTVQDFIQYKYMDALQTLDKFFRKHIKTNIRKVSYRSQSVRHKIDLASNIRSLNNANIHQIKKEAVAYSEIAFIALYALKQFKREKLPHIDHQKEQLTQKTNSVVNTIHKKFKNDQTFRFKEREVITNRIAKLFKKNTALKKVYQSILILIGMEHFRSQNQSQTLQKLDNMVALFFQAADLYEWVVYDALAEQCGSGVKIWMAKFGETRKGYFLKSTVEDYKRFSEPDFIIEEGHQVTIVDAKWKILKEVGDIQFSDIAKLKRDVDIRKALPLSQKTKAKLIYPKINFDFEAENPFQHDYETGFEFSIERIEVE